jgi:alpha-L-rhamnosidase
MNISTRLVLSLLAWLFAAGQAEAGKMAVKSLRCEYRTDPQGIDVRQPRLGWKIEADGRAQVQSAYEVLVSSTRPGLAADRGDLWESGRVESGQSAHVIYGGAALKSRQRCYWKVRVWDQAGRPSNWNPPAAWSMGLLEAADWKARWIGLDGGENPDHFAAARWVWSSDDPKPEAGNGPRPRHFRRAISLPAGREVLGARLTIAARGVFSVRVNEREVRQDSKTVFGPASEVDLEPFLQPGTNVIGIVTTPSDKKAEPPGLLCAFSAEFDAGDPLVVRSDAAWKVSATAPEGWDRPGFDDSTWAAAQDRGSNDPSVANRIVGDDYRRLPARMLRREFSLDRPVARATACLCGLGLSELWINGRKIGDRVLSPGLTDYHRRCLYVTCDVTENLRHGANALGVILGNGRYFAPRKSAPTTTLSYGYPKLLVQLEIEYTDGTADTVVSDGSWKLTTNGPILANSEYDGETYDARREIPGWERSGFNEAGWTTATLVEAPKGVLSAEMAEPIRVMERIRPVAVTNPQPGVWVFDTGQNMAGWCRLRVKGPRGTRIFLRHAETLRSNGSLNIDNLRSAKATDAYTLRGGGSEEYEPRFTYHGFRYVEVTGYPGRPALSALEGRVVHDAVPRSGTFACSEALVNRIYRNMVWSIRDNYRSLPTDCPQRDERQGWFGDRAQVSRGEMYVFDTAALHTKWVRDMEDSQREDGSLPDLAPAYWSFYTGSITFPTAAFAIPRHLHDLYGDQRILLNHYDCMRKWAEMTAGRLSGDLLPADTYGDWCVPPESLDLIWSADPARVTDRVLVANAYYYSDLCMLARYAARLGRDDDARRYSGIADRVKAAFNARFLNRAAGLYANGTQTSAVLPLAFGLVPEDCRARVFASLVDNIVRKTDLHVGTGMIGGQWLLRVLSDNGRPDLAWKLAAQSTYPSWGYMVASGATTIWELWNGDHGDPLMNSGNHVMQIGDLCTWLHEYVAGIAPDESRPGFRHVLMRPRAVGELAWARASHVSLYGPIASEWNTAGGRFEWHISLPPNTTATVFVPAQDPREVTESGRPADRANGVRFVRMEGDRAVFEVGSGRYAFASPSAASRTAPSRTKSLR